MTTLTASRGSPRKGLVLARKLRKLLGDPNPNAVCEFMEVQYTHGTDTWIRW
jgi:hypothetical protein